MEDSVSYLKNCALTIVEIFNKDIDNHQRVFNTLVDRLHILSHNVTSDPQFIEEFQNRKRIVLQQKGLM